MLCITVIHLLLCTATKATKNSSDILADLHKRAQFINDIREFVFSETLS